MSNSYPIQRHISLIGSKVNTPALNTPNQPASFALTGATLTAAYSGNQSASVSVGGMFRTVFNCQYISGGTGNTLNLKFEFSQDGVNWFQETAETTTATLTTEYLIERKFDNNGSNVAGTTYNFRITMDVAEQFMRVSAKETVVGAGFSTLYMEIVTSGR